MLTTCQVGNSLDQIQAEVNGPLSWVVAEILEHAVGVNHDSLGHRISVSVMIEVHASKILVDNFRTDINLNLEKLPKELVNVEVGNNVVCACE